MFCSSELYGHEQAVGENAASGQCARKGEERTGTQGARTFDWKDAFSPVKFGRSLFCVSCFLFSETWCEGLTATLYASHVLPTLVDQITSCKDAIAQEYLMECIVQVFPGEPNIQVFFVALCCWRFFFCFFFFFSQMSFICWLCRPCLKLLPDWLKA